MISPTVNNVIRPEFKYISGSDGFYYELQSEVPIGRGRHDFASNDSNKLGIYFSPSGEHVKKYGNFIIGAWQSCSIL